MSPIEEKLSDQFYKWELRGRGWRVFPEPVHPEPPFSHFQGHFLPDAPVIDDGRRPTFLSSLVDKLSRSATGKPKETSPVQESEEAPEPHVLIRDPPIELQTSLPAKLDIGKEPFEQFLRNLAFCHEPIAFEMLGTPGRVNVQFAANTADAPIVRRQLQAYFAAMAEREHIKVTRFSRKQLNLAFIAEGPGTKHALAEHFATRFRKELGFRLPPKRKCGMNEDCRMDMFDAVALAAHFLKGRE